MNYHRKYINLAICTHQHMHQQYRNYIFTLLQFGFVNPPTLWGSSAIAASYVGGLSWSEIDVAPNVERLLHVANSGGIHWFDVGMGSWFGCPKNEVKSAMNDAFIPT